MPRVFGSGKQSAGTQLQTLDAGASNQVALFRIRVGRTNATTAGSSRHHLTRVTGGVTPVDAVEQRHNTRSPATNVAIVTVSWTTDPSSAGLPPIQICSGDRRSAIGQWTAPRPWACYVLIDSAIAEHRTTNTTTFESGFGFLEGGPSLPIGRRPPRRPRRRGIVHYSSEETWQDKTVLNNSRTKNSWCAHVDTFGHYRSRLRFDRSAVGGSLVLYEAVVVGQAAVVAQADRLRAIGAAASGLGAVAAQQSLTRAIEATLSGLGAVSAEMSATRSIAAQVQALAAVAAQADRLRALDAIVAGLGAADAAMSPTRSLSVVVAGSGAVVADITVTAGGVLVLFQADVSGLGVVSADLARLRSIEAAVAGSGAALVPSLGVTRGLAALSAGEAQVAAAVARTLGLSVSAAGLGQLAAEMARTRAFGAGVVGLGSASVSLEKLKEMAALVAGLGQASASVVLQEALAAAVAGQGLVSTPLNPYRGLSVTAVGSSQILSALVVSIRLAATLAGQGTVVVIPRVGPLWLKVVPEDSIVLVASVEDAQVLTRQAVDDPFTLVVSTRDSVTPPAASSDTLVLVGAEEDER